MKALVLRTNSKIVVASSIDVAKVYYWRLWWFQRGTI